MKWTPINKAKVKFGVIYLVAYDGNYYVSTLTETKQTVKGLQHSFDIGGETLLTEATHVAIITDPTKE